MVDEDLGNFLDKEKTDWKNKGNNFFKQARYEDAITCYNAALAIDPVYIDVLNNKGMALVKLGRIEEAKQINEKLNLLKEKPKIERFAEKQSFLEKSFRNIFGKNSPRLEPGFYCPNCSKELPSFKSEICPNCGVRIKDKTESDPCGCATIIGILFIFFGLIALAATPTYPEWAGGPITGAVIGVSCMGIGFYGLAKGRGWV